MPPRLIGLAVAGAAVLAFPASSLSAGGLLIKPNPIEFGGVEAGTGKSKRIVVENTGVKTAKVSMSITPTSPTFKLLNDDCSGKLLKHGQICALFVTYHPSSKSEDSATLVAHNQTGPGSTSAQMTGHRVAGDTTPPNCTMIAARNQKLVKKVKKNGKKVLKRTPFKLGLTSSEDGTVSAFATGKAANGKAISLAPDDRPATAGNGVQLELKLKKASEKLVLADVKNNLQPQMTLRATCQDKAGNPRQITTVIKFRDKKPGPPFGFPLIADPQLK